jgi:S-adenosylmethionine:tRNA-ribosyltransferase-isomerase (queuine synthetase)
VLTSDFDFHLPEELIAQTPAPRRDQSRLLVLARQSGQLAHKHFRDLLDYLQPGDVLVLNNSRVIPARLRGLNAQTGGQFEILLLEEVSQNDWWVMLRPGKRARIGTRIIIRDREQSHTNAGSHLPLPQGEGRGEGGEDSINSRASKIQQFIPIRKLFWQSH